MAHSIVSDYKSDILYHLRKIFPIENFSEKDVQKLLRISEVRKYRTGQVIIEQGQTDGTTYYLVSGQVRVEKDGALLHILRRSGDVFGEMSAIDGFQRTASVMALENSICVAINMRRLENLAEAESYAFKYMLYKKISKELAAKLRTTTTRLLQVTKELGELKRKGRKR